MDARACPFDYFPVFFIPHNGGGERPPAASSGFDRVDEAFFFLGKKDAELVPAGLQLETAHVFLTETGKERVHGHYQETGDIFHFPFYEKNAALAVTAMAAHLTLKGFHNR